MALHSQDATLIIAQQQTLLAEFLRQCLDLVVLELNDLLLAFVEPFAGAPASRMCQGWRMSCIGRNCIAECDSEFG
ncbi:MAG: hypothetical protein H8E37_00770 [Planctomycetes bacterium]|nr:hypothetical protein [Planctomycetota bacterium]